MKNTIWKWLTRNHIEGMLLTPPLQVAFVLLYPLRYLAYRIGEVHGYNWKNDTWMIEGVRYSGRALRMMAASQGEVYRFTRTGETVTLTRLEQ